MRSDFSLGQFKQFKATRSGGEAFTVERTCSTLDLAWAPRYFFLQVGFKPFEVDTWCWRCGLNPSTSPWPSCRVQYILPLAQVVRHYCTVQQYCLCGCGRGPSLRADWGPSGLCLPTLLVVSRTGKRPRSWLTIWSRETEVWLLRLAHYHVSTYFFSLNYCIYITSLYIEK